MPLPLPPLWIVHPQDEKKSHALSSALGVSAFVAQLLINRGIADSEGADLFLKTVLAKLHDPFQLADMDRGVDRVMQAIAQQERIAVYGDYDVDGTTSSALLFDFFRDIGIEIEVYIPDRIKEGYSLNNAALDFLKAKGVSVVVTVDNGISALECARHASEIGLDLIITDHHEVMAALPVAVAIINPKRSDNHADFSGVAGVGVAFYMAMALRKRLREAGYFSSRPEPNLVRLLDLVAVGTVADVAPLAGQNRILVKRGLEILRKGERPGLRVLADVSSIAIERADSGAIGFRLGPRINAGGRIGEPKDGFYLLSAQTLEEARPFAMRLNAENDRRRKIEEKILEEAQSIYESQQDGARSHVCMVAKREWNPGVIGIVASRLVEKYHRPAIVLAWDGKVWKGSARSIPGFAIHSAIGECREHLIQFGGHPQAAGLSVAEEKLQDFYRAFAAYGAAQLKPEDFQKRIHVDMVLSSPLELAHLEEIALLEPLGMQNPTPLFVYEGSEVLSIKRLSEGKHLKLSLRHRGVVIDAIAFRYPQARYDAILAHSKTVSLAFRAELNIWQGQRKISHQIVDLRS